MTDKKSIRRQMKALNGALPAREREAAASRILQTIEKWQPFAVARTVALFCALSDEPPTAEMIRRWSVRKRIVLPRVEGDTMRFYAYDPQAMREGAFGIDEPQSGTPCDPAEIDLMLVPGVAFTLRGERLGRGKGFYDKYLSLPGLRAVKVGVCYAHQIVGELPCEAHDVRMDTVVEG